MPAAMLLTLLMDLATCLCELYNQAHDGWLLCLLRRYGGGKCVEPTRWTRAPSGGSESHRSTCRSTWRPLNAQRSKNQLKYHLQTQTTRWSDDHDKISCPQTSRRPCEEQRDTHVRVQHEPFPQLEPRGSPSNPSSPQASFT